MRLYRRDEETTKIAILYWRHSLNKVSHFRLFCVFALGSSIRIQFFRDAISYECLYHGQWCCLSEMWTLDETLPVRGFCGVGVESLKNKNFLSIKGRIIPWVSYINTEIRLVNLERTVFRGCGTRNQLSCAEFKGILTHCMSNRTGADYHENTRTHLRCYEDYRRSLKHSAFAEEPP